MKQVLAYFFLIILMAPIVGFVSMGSIQKKYADSKSEYYRVQKVEDSVMQYLLQLPSEMTIHLIGVSKKHFIADENSTYKFDASSFYKWKDLHQKVSFLLDKFEEEQASDFAFIVFLNSLFFNHNHVECIFVNETIALNGFYINTFTSSIKEILTPPPRL